MENEMNAIIQEAGNGFPQINDVVENDQGCFQIMEYVGVIQTPGFGKSNYLHAKIKPVDIQDDIFPARLIF
jgi:hypothetical protein